jgi:D-glutamate cyclase
MIFEKDTGGIVPGFFLFVRSLLSAKRSARRRAVLMPMASFSASYYSQGRARIDYLVEEATTSQIPTIGVGDGGNEIGMGAVAEAVHQYVPHGNILCAKLATDVLLPAGVSNWGCYAIQAALAVMTGKPDLIHTAAMERRLVEAAANAGLVDGNTGKCEPTVDGLPIEVHAGIVELLAATAQRGLKKLH